MTADNGFLKNCFALTGSISTGKSAVAAMLQDLGAHIIDTDLIAREVVEPGKPAMEEIRRHFGGEVICDDGTLNREKLREEIIRDPDRRETLNRITHPRINEVVLDRITQCNEMNDGMPIIIDVPLLFESGWERFFPRIILAYAPVPVQTDRLMARDRLDRHTAELTIAAQMSIEEKKGRATYLIDNSGALDDTRKQVKVLFRTLLEATGGR